MTVEVLESSRWESWMVAVDVETQATIARPRHEVAAYASNPENATAWYANITEVQGDCAGPVETGAEFAFVAEFLGRCLVYTYEVVEHVPDTRLVMRTAEGPFPMERSMNGKTQPMGVRE
nr:SRPBCC family protein [Rhodococcus sp. MSC1_016]